MTGPARSGACCLLVDVGPAERGALGTLADAKVVASTDLESGLACCPSGVDVVVVGSLAPAPVGLVQRAHRAAPDAGIAVVTSADSAEQVRRSISYAPAVPLDVLVLGTDAPIAEEVARLRAAVVQRRRHRELVAAVSARAQAPPASGTPRVVELGALLEHAPLGVLVCDVDGAVLGWNGRAGALLRLDASSRGPRVEQVLTGAGELVDGVATATAAGSTMRDLAAAGGVELEVSAVRSQLDDGRPVVLLLLADVTERRAAERARDRLAAQVAVLARVSESLTRSLDMTEALNALAQTLVPDLADWVSIQVADETGGLGVVAMHHRDPALADVVEQARERQAVAASDDAPSRRATRTNEPFLVAAVDEESLAAFVPDPTLRDLLRRLGTGSAIAVPLPGRRAVLGSMVLVNQPGSRPLSETDVTVALEAGRRAGIALDNARLYGQQRDLATELQRILLTAPPQPDHSEIAVRYVAAAQEAQVGGDWYDAFVQPDGATVLVIGDVIGHDTRAAAAMSQLRGVLRGIGFTTSAEPAEVLTRVDAAVEGLLIATTATAVVARLEQTPADLRAGMRVLSWSNAGHLPPIVLDPDGRVRVLGGEDGGDLLLGIDPGTARATHRTDVAAGSTVLLYTDGLVERRGQSLDDGIARLAAVLDECRDLTLDELCDTALRRLLPDEPEDDVALVAVRLHPQHGPRRPESGRNRVPPTA